MNNIKLLSYLITSDTPSYGNKDKIIIRKNDNINLGNTSNTSTWIFTNNHIGTHIDAPFHFDKNGKKLSDFQPDFFLFKNIQVIIHSCDTSKLININDLNFSLIDKKCEFLIIKTNYGKFRKEKKYWNESPSLSFVLCKYIRENFPNLRLIGFDFISLTSQVYKEEGKKCHIEFLSNKEKPILIVEDMNLTEIKNNDIEWAIVSPLFIEDGNGSPVTIFSKIK